MRGVLPDDRCDTTRDLQLLLRVGMFSGGVSLAEATMMYRGLMRATLHMAALPSGSDHLHMTEGLPNLKACQMEQTATAATLVKSDSIAICVREITCYKCRSRHHHHRSMGLSWDTVLTLQVKTETACEALHNPGASGP